MTLILNPLVLLVENATVPSNDQQMAALHQTSSSSRCMKKGGECHFPLLKWQKYVWVRIIPPTCICGRCCSSSTFSFIHPSALSLLHPSIIRQTLRPPSVPSAPCSFFFLEHFGINDTWISIGTSKIHKKEYIKQILKMEFVSLKMQEVTLCESVLL